MCVWHLHSLLVFMCSQTMIFLYSMQSSLTFIICCMLQLRKLWKSGMVNVHWGEIWEGDLPIPVSEVWGKTWKNQHFSIPRLKLRRVYHPCRVGSKALARMLNNICMLISSYYFDSVNHVLLSQGYIQATDLTVYSLCCMLLLYNYCLQLSVISSVS